MSKYAAELLDPTSKYAVPRFSVDPSSAESLLESISNIRNSGYPQEQVQQMLGYARVVGKELLADPAVATELAGIEDVENPLSIELTKENYSLIFGSLDEYKSLADKQLAQEDTDTGAKDSKIAALEAQVAEMQAKLDEKPAEQTEEPTEQPTEQPAEQTETPTDEPTEQPTEQTDSELQTKLEAAETKAAQAEQRAISAEEKLKSAREQIAELSKSTRVSAIEKVAELATKLAKPYTRDKSKEEVIAYLESRTPESITDMLSDFTEELASKETPEQTPTEQTEIPAVADPTLQEQDQTNSETGAAESNKTDIDGLSDKLHGDIKRESEGIYRLETPTQLAQRLIAEQSKEGAA